MACDEKTVRRQLEDCKCGNCADCTIARFEEVVKSLESSRDGWKALAKDNGELLKLACSERDRLREALEILDKNFAVAWFTRYGIDIKELLHETLSE